MEFYSLADSESNLPEEIRDFRKEKGTFSLIGAGINQIWDRYFKNYGNVFHFIQRELNTRDEFSLSLPYRLWLYRNGFLSESGVLFGLDRSNVDQYLSILRMYLRTHDINGRAGIVLEDKYLFQKVIGQQHGEHVPRTFGRIIGDSFTDTSGNEFDLVKKIESVLNEEDQIVIKPVMGSGGGGVQIVRNLDDLSTLKTYEEYLVSEFVSQHEYSANIFPGSVNTIRVMTMIDPATNEPFIPAAVHRFGTTESEPVDNWSSGGLTAGIDTETGEIQRVVTQPDTYHRLWHKTHPDTDACIDGTKIPYWNDIREGILDIADVHKTVFKYVGWDIVVTDDERQFIVLEGNEFPSVTVIQPHVPLLADRRTRRFYRHHGVT